MDKHPKKQKILLVLIVLTLCFIWGNSLMPATFSGAISGWAKNVLNAILGDMGNSGMSGDGVLRKIAHASEFAVLGVLLTLLMEEECKTKLSFLVLYGLGVAFVDETIQLFVDGRSGQIQDVWIDLAGFVVGVAIVGAILLLVYSRNTRRLHRVNGSTHNNKLVR